MRLHDLDTFDTKAEQELWGLASKEKGSIGQGIYFKAIYLCHEYFAFVFFTDKDDSKSLKLRIYKVEDNNNYYPKVINENFIGYDLDTRIKLHEFYKIDNVTLLLITTYYQNKIYIMFIDTYKWYRYMNVRTYKYEMKEYYLREELSVDFYNDFLMFTTDVSKNDETYLSSFLIFFSYPNGTDFYMNLSPYVMDSGYYLDGNLVSYLLSTSRIENNIFDYSPIEEIKLISIPDEI